MYYFITASKDATIYLQQPDQNTGLDEILEVSKVYYGNIKDISRALIQFDTTVYSSSLSQNVSWSMDDVRLLMRECETEEVPLDFTLFAYPISGSWEMGKGTRFDNLETDGVTWNNRNGDASNINTPSTWNPSQTLSGSVTASNDDGIGGVWFDDVVATQQFTYETRDVDIDVSSIFSQWISGSKDNNGFILKYSTEREDDISDYGILKFFGKETNTIHQPKIRIGWDDSSFTTGSLEGIPDGSIRIALTNFKNEYRVNSTPRIKIFSRDLYPPKTFNSTFEYTVAKYLPITTYYQVRDYHTDDIIIPFGEYSKVSCNSMGNFFDLNLTNWETQRTYKLEFKVVRDGIDEYFDDGYTFKVIE